MVLPFKKKENEIKNKTKSNYKFCKEENENKAKINNEKIAVHLQIKFYLHAYFSICVYTYTWKKWSCLKMNELLVFVLPLKRTWWK